ncbi:MAG: nitroreductase [Alphaproteobacteria bacterium]|nr:nitroreductase [Alphaproteobacteria bacterium]
MPGPIIDPPELGEEAAPCRQSDEAIELLSRRRSTSVEWLTSPGPSSQELSAILRIGARAPDHRRVTPYRFIVLEGEDRATAGAAVARAFAAANPDADQARTDVEANRFMRAPVVVALVSRVDAAHKTPVWEQQLTAGAVGQNLLVAASAYGYAAQWLTEWYAFDAEVARAFGLSHSDAVTERFAGFFYFGSAAAPPRERARPDMATIITRFADITTN